MNKIIKNQASLWLIEQKEGLSKKRQMDFDIWLEDGINKKIYDELNHMEKHIDLIPEDLKEKLRNEVYQELEEKTISFKPFLLAASILLVVFISMFTYHNSSKILYTKVFETNHEILKNIKLPDNTIVSLDAQTKMKIEYFNDKRDVTLMAGNVMFDIGKDKNRPFTIYTKRNTIQDIGTVFEVSLKDEDTKVKVKEGVVRIGRIYSNKQDAKSLYILKKEDSVTLNKYGKISNISKIPLNQIGAWEDNNVNFNDTPLNEAINIFLKYTLQKVDIDKRLQNIKITGDFKSNELENFINSLTLIFPIKIEKEGKVFYLKKDV